MLRRTKFLVGVLLLSVLFQGSIFAKAEVKKNEKISEHITAFKLVKRRTAWMYNLEIFNPDKKSLIAKIIATTEDDKNIEIAKHRFSKHGISKKFENLNYKKLEAKLFKVDTLLSNETIDIPQVTAQIKSFVVRGDRWFLKVRNKTTVSMTFDIEVFEEDTNGMKTSLLKYKTQNLDPEVTHSRTDVLKNLNINNRLTLVVNDPVTKKVLAAKTLTLK